MTLANRQTGTSGPTIMLVDDDETDQLIYKRVIARAGSPGEVISFYYADEALDFLKRDDRQKVDVILLDINLPRMNGFEFLEAATKELGGRLAEIVIVVLTTSLNPNDRERAGEFDVVKSFINKPLTVDDVKSVVEILDHQRSI